MAVSIPGLMLVNESLLARMSDPDDDFVAMVCAHEVAHLWFGGQVSMRWWEDLWLDEAMATYLSYTVDLDAFADPWTAFCTGRSRAPTPLGASVGLRPALWVATLGGVAGFVLLLPTPLPRFRMPEGSS